MAEGVAGGAAVGGEVGASRPPCQGADRKRRGGGVVAARIQAAPKAAQAAQPSASSRSAASAEISLCHSVIQSSASLSNASGPAWPPPGSAPAPEAAPGRFLCASSSGPVIANPVLRRAAGVGTGQVPGPGPAPCQAAPAEHSATGAPRKGQGTILLFALHHAPC